MVGVAGYVALVHVWQWSWGAAFPKSRAPRCTAAPRAGLRGVALLKLAARGLATLRGPPPLLVVHAGPRHATPAPSVAREGGGAAPSVAGEGGAVAAAAPHRSWSMGLVREPRLMPYHIGRQQSQDGAPCSRQRGPIVVPSGGAHVVPLGADIVPTPSGKAARTVVALSSGQWHFLFVRWATSVTHPEAFSVGRIRTGACSRMGHMCWH